MDTLLIGLGIITLVILFLLVIIVIVLFFQLNRLQSKNVDYSPILLHMTTLSDKISQIEPVIQSVNSLQL